MSKYKIQKYLKTTSPETGKICFVAIVTHPDEPQPFRIECENYEDIADVVKDVKDWIATREEDDARRVANSDAERIDREADAKLEALNKDLEPEEAST